MAKPREFDLYWCLDEDGSISPYDSSICENDVKWVDGSDFAEPNCHVIEYSAYSEAVKLLERIANHNCEIWPGSLDKKCGKCSVCLARKFIEERK